MGRGGIVAEENLVDDLEWKREKLKLLYLAPKSLLTHNLTYCNLTSVFLKYLASGPLQGLKNC